MASHGERLQALWQRLAPLPMGRWLFSRTFGWFVPYSNTIGATVLSLEPGYCRTTMPDRRRVRNHLDSIHAVALINLGELTSGLAMTMSFPDGVRGIVTTLSAEYFKKARGTLTGESRVTIPPIGAEPVETRIETTISDAGGEPVCRIHAVWRLARSDRGGS
jgi:acyl-coenzyme A thioesterase PaaI-like protein